MKFLKKNIPYLLCCIFFFLVHGKLFSIEPIEIGKPYQDKMEINFSILDTLIEGKTEEIYIDKDVRTKIKNIKKNIETVKKPKEKNIKEESAEKKIYAYVNEKNINNYKNKIEIFFESNSSNIKDVEKNKITKFMEQHENKEKINLKITAYAKSKNGDEVARRVSLDRAINIRSEILNSGVPAENLIVKAFGDTKKNNLENKVIIEVSKKK